MCYEMKLWRTFASKLDNQNEMDEAWEKYKLVKMTQKETENLNWLVKSEYIKVTLKINSPHKKASPRLCHQWTLLNT
jgi:hypothetical protein